jgi:hypothetical protein
MKEMKKESKELLMVAVGVVLLEEEVMEGETIITESLGINKR